ncbi:MAG: hypothetical protein FH748_03740 [Balneolaceae bacterium]|nr:hypothetical protein [Balneolaceae bacterium]
MNISYRLIMFKGAVILLLFFGLWQNTHARQATVTDTVSYAFLPALSYNTDIGFLAGGIMDRYQFKEGVRPFYSYMSTAAIASTKGLISAQLFIDRPEVFNSNFRVSSETYFSRFLQDQYYGIGNYGKLDNPPENKPDYYMFQSFSAGQTFSLRAPIWYAATNHHLDLIGSLDAAYQTPFDNDSTHLITLQAPPGYKGGATISLGGGLIWDSRDSEFRPTTGNRFRVEGKLANKFYGSSFNYFLLEAEARTYTSFHLIRKITFANRILFEHSSGDAPYWKLPYAGGEETMRGYPENRFMDDNMIVFNTELRTWLFSLPSIDAEFGGTLFIDIGNSFSNGTSFNHLLKDLNYTFGFGGTSSFFNENFIFRGDFGFSDEDMGVYFTAGYMF